MEKKHDEIPVIDAYPSGHGRHDIANGLDHGGLSGPVRAKDSVDSRSEAYGKIAFVSSFTGYFIILANLGMPIYDKKREDIVHEKIERLSKGRNLDVDIINQIVCMLIILSKNEQKKILMEEC